MIFSGKTKVVDVICSITDQYCNVDTIDDTVTGSFQQIDLNRHLEEVAQSIESILVQTIRNLILSQANLRRSSVIKLLQSWEKYNALTTKSNGNLWHHFSFIVQIIQLISIYSYYREHCHVR